MIHRLRRLFGQRPFAVLVAALGFLAYNWPFMEPARAAGTFSFFSYLFGIWAVIILIAFLISRAAASPDANRDGSDV